MNSSHCEFAAKIKEAEHGALRHEDTPCATCVLTEDSSHTLAFDEGRMPEAGNLEAERSSFFIY